MPQEDARRFVARMKEDPEFRQKVIQADGPEQLDSCLRGAGMLFTQQELIGAMAECMAQMEKQMRG